MTYKTFCGGIFETNCYLLKAPEGGILFDAPDGACEWVRSLGVDPKLLLLTHGHIDHVQDVAKIKRQFGCPIGCHPLTAPMISDREFFRSFGFELEIEPAKPDLLIGGDVLFAGSIGRGDLPGGDTDLLVEKIRKKLFPLGDEVTVLPGHGPPTLIGTERRTNPFVGLG